MRRRSARWTLIPFALATVLAAVACMAWAAHATMRRDALAQMRSSLRMGAELLGICVTSAEGVPPGEAIQALCRRLGRHVHWTVILPSGLVVGDSRSSASSLTNHSRRPDFMAAMRGEVGEAVEWDAIRRHQVLRVAVPIREDGRVVAVARASAPLDAAAFSRLAVLRPALLVCLGVGGCAVLLAGGIAGRFQRTAGRMAADVDVLRRGRLDVRLAAPGCRELAGLAGSVNQAAEALQRRIAGAESERNEREAVFGSMIETVLAVDVERRVLHVNRAGRELFAIEADPVRGKTLQELIRHPELQRVAERVLACDQAIEEEVTLLRTEEVILKVRGTALRDSAGRRIGGLLVIQDITHERRLERIRRDFVGNVSHELKTPITAIKGFVETLLEGAAENPAERQRFLAIVARHADRLNAIVNDLLSLARIEHVHGGLALDVTDSRLAGVLRQAVEICEEKARFKRIEVDVRCDPELRAGFNPQLLEHAVSNLVDNAIKYSPEGSRVAVGASRTNGRIEIEVADQGMGIPAKHLPRLFERFYRVDEGRSRQQGDTGLGLAIVKHVALVHGGGVDVRSGPGGSVFSLHIPNKPATKSGRVQQNGGAERMRNHRITQS